MLGLETHSIVVMDFSHPEHKAHYFPNIETIKTCLQKHQRKDLAWMLKREKESYKTCFGGILGNDPGLGKTLTCLALIATHVVRTTLIIVPASLIENWIAEIQKHTSIQVDTNVFIYYGANRIKALEKLACNPDIRIIITTYGTLTSETEKGHKNNDLILLNYNFDRVIWDEAHAMKNKTKKTFRTMKSINAKYRWVITATPTPNYPKEIFSYLKILNLNIKEKDFDMKKKQDILHLQRAIFPICMFRLKEQVLDLPKKNYENVFVVFSSEERIFYDTLRTYSQIRIQKLIQRYHRLGTNSEISRKLRMKTYNSICTMILRLRQACDFPSMTMEGMERTKGKTIIEAVEILKYYSQDKKFEEECILCMNATANVISKCNHRACENCWKLWNGPCPFCRMPIYARDLHYIEDARKPPDDNYSSVSDDDIYSSKAEKLFREHLPYILNRGEKAIISSQFLKCLAYMQRRFKKEYPHLKFLTIDGSVPPRSRNKLLDTFRNDSNCPVCFISFTSSPEGLNIIEAKWVIIFEKYWNSKKELQLVDRTHRIGQTKQVNIINYFVKDTIEERILELVKYKDEQIDMFFQNKEPQEGENWMAKTIKLLE